MAKRATINLQALSLKAPKNWAIRSPRRAFGEAGTVDEAVWSEAIEEEFTGFVVGQKR
jgi:hypothetical protein